MARFTIVMLVMSLHCLVAFTMDCSGRQTAMDMVSGVDRSGQTYVITGGDGGMGYETALAIASTKARVILACRSATKCPAAAVQIIKATGNKNISVIPLDLSSFHSIRTCVVAIRNAVSRVDVLISNAGILKIPKRLAAKTDDGFDRIMQVNFLGNHLLVQEMLPLLRESGGRVVNVASFTSFFACLWGNYGPDCTSLLNIRKLATKSPWGWNTEGTPASNYGLAKYADVFTTAELARREQNITAVCVHPGMTATDLAKGLPPTTMAEWCLASSGQRPCPRNAAQGAATQTYLAVVSTEELSDGSYYYSCAVHKSVRDKYFKKHGEFKTIGYQSSIYDLASELIGPTQAVINHNMTFAV